VSSGEASLGESIAQLRDDAGLTIEQVAERTRIRATVIRAIENDDFSLSGGDVYARGHLRSIAQVLKTDPAPLLARFDEAHGVPAPTVTEVFEAETSTQRERRGANWSAVMAAALVIAVGLVAVQVFRSDSDGSRQTTVIDNPTPSISEREDSSSPEPSESESQIAQVPPNEVVLKVSALPDAISWVQVSRADGSVLFEGNIGQGASKTFRDRKELSVVVGNAAGVTLNVNGSDLGTPGASGEVARVTFTPDDPSGAAG